MLDYHALGLQPVLDPVQNLVYHAHAHDVELVMVDGNVLVDRRRFVTIDRDAVIDAARRASQAAWGRFEAKYGGPIAAA
jgi:5-methylthioadenosine/S-adenosylhomocysteine deaminase